MELALRVLALNIENPMNKLTILALVSAALVGSAFAQTTKATKASATPKTIACAVMPGNNVDIATATKSNMFADYNGKRYFFCCGGCPGAFKADPAKYAKGASIKSPKAPKKA